MSKNNFSINLIGHATANLGLGHTTREFARIILERELPLSILDLDAGHGRSKFDLSFAAYTVKSAQELPYGVNLAIGGGEALSDWMLDSLADPGDETRINAAFVWWELPDMPLPWIEAARAFDVLIAGSEFTQATLNNVVPGVPVLLARHPIRMPGDVAPNRERFGLPAEALLFYTGFEPYSDPVRKNPFGAIEAFQRAFPGRSDCRLVIKVNNADAQGARGELLNKMYAIARDDSRILLLKENLPYTDLLTLYASCDVFISLHRSEGLGLVPLEAMRLGKAVVATGWSGNMSYMNHRNACLVTYELRPTDNSSPNYGPKTLGVQSHWAEPDIDHAAAWLRKLADEPDFRAALGVRAAEDSARYEVLARQADFVDELNAIWKSKNLTPRRDRSLVMKRVMQARRQMRLNQLTPAKKLATELTEYLGHQFRRYILWRFRNNQQSRQSSATKTTGK